MYSQMHHKSNNNCLIILQIAVQSMDNAKDRGSFNNKGSLDSKTILILFVEIVFILIYLISLTLIVMRRAKKFIESQNRKYFIVIVFYIASKLILCGILIMKVIVGLVNQQTNINPDDVELIIKTSLVLTNFSIIQLFLIALETYLSHCFSVIADASSKRRQKTFIICLKGMQVLVALILLIPLIVYDVDELGYSIVNGMDIGLNLLIIIAFLATFFYLSFKMSGIMMQNKLNEVIKRIYKVQLIILVSRAVTITFEIIVALYILPNTFYEEIDIISNDIKYQIVLGMIFVGSVIFLLLTEGLPVMYSLRGAVVEAINFKSEFPSQKQNLAESLIDRSQDESKISEFVYKELRLKNFSRLTDLKVSKDDSIWTCKKGEFEGKDFFIRIPKNQISSYIFEDIENQIAMWNQLNLKSLSKIAYFCEGEIIHFVEKYYDVNIDQRASQMSSQAELLQLALQLAQGIRDLHEKDIVHGCLTPNHVFIHDSQVVLNGVGLNSLKKYLSLITGYTNKTIYTATEHLRDKNNVIIKPKKSADIYSFGIILYEMVTKNRQYRQLTLRDVQAKFVQESFRPKLPDHIKHEVKNLIRKCWNEASDKRPPIEEVIQTLRRIS